MEVREFPIAVCSCSCSCSCSFSKRSVRSMSIRSRKLSVACLAIFSATILLPWSLTSCGKKNQEGEKKTVHKSEDDFLDKDAKPDDRKYLWAAKPCFLAVANQKYADAYALLSRHAKARM